MDYKISETYEVDVAMTGINKGFVDEASFLLSYSNIIIYTKRGAPSWNASLYKNYSY